MSSNMQSLILSKDYFNKRQAQSWIRRHKQFKYSKMDEKPRTYRFRLREPNETLNEYKIKPFSEGIKAVMGVRLLTRANASVPFYQMY